MTFDLTAAAPGGSSGLKGRRCQTRHRLNPVDILGDLLLHVIAPFKMNNGGKLLSYVRFSASFAVTEILTARHCAVGQSWWSTSGIR